MIEATPNQSLARQRFQGQAGPQVQLFDPERPRRKKRHRLADFLREPELQAILDTARRIWQQTEKQRGWRKSRQRDYLMILTAYHCALRVQELVNLEIHDIDLTAGLVVVRQGKGCKDGVVPIPSQVAELLKEWVGERTAGVLFPDPRGQHIDPSHFRVRLKYIAGRAGVTRRVHPHILRHTRATHLLRNGVDVFEVKALLRHSSLSSTAQYLHLVPGRLREVVEAMGKVVSP